MVEKYRQGGNVGCADRIVRGHENDSISSALQFPVSGRERQIEGPGTCGRRCGQRHSWQFHLDYTLNTKLEMLLSKIVGKTIVIITQCAQRRGLSVGSYKK